MKKTIIIPIICLALFAAIVFAGYYTGKLSYTSAKRQENRYNGTIEFQPSDKDTDADGIEDRTDLLQGAIDYVATRPHYKSKYYETGYPNDTYGVCTDVVSNAMKAAGFDLMDLVQKDIQKNPDAYEIDEPDPNIDFRRVRNLKVFFRNNAIEETIDVTDIDNWQGGDIVIFEGHIGIVSDRRNTNGVPYVIHHNSTLQTGYEQDILEKRDDLVAHYRMP